MSSLPVAEPRLSRPVTRRAFVAGLTATACLAATGTARAQPAAAAATPLQKWLARPLVRIAHRGGSADWPEGSPLAYRAATDWNTALALEFPARRTRDGVWVASEEGTTGRVFGTDLNIATSTWSQLSGLRSIDRSQPMSRLQQTVLDKVPRNRILFVDDKDDAYVDELLDLLDRYGGKGRAVVKSFYQFTNTPKAAQARGYKTWGYYYERYMDEFAATNRKFSMLGMEYSAPAATFRKMTNTGKRVFAHIVATDPEADMGTSKGATGLMVSGVRAVVPHS